MRLAEFLFDRLSNDAMVSALVDTRIYPMRLPEKAVINTGAISWRRIDAQRDYTYSTYEDTSPWVRARVQFDCWAYSYDQADLLGDAVLLALSGYTGYYDPDVGLIDAINELDTYEPATKFFRRIIDFRISYEEQLAES